MANVLKITLCLIAVPVIIHMLFEFLIKKRKNKKKRIHSGSPHHGKSGFSQKNKDSNPHRQLNTEEIKRVTRIVALVSSILFIFTYLFYPLPSEKYHLTFRTAMLYTAIISFLCAYFSEIVTFAGLGIGVWIVYDAGTTAQGFQFQAVSITAWLLSLLLVNSVYFIRRIYI